MNRDREKRIKEIRTGMLGQIHEITGAFSDRYNYGVHLLELYLGRFFGLLREVKKIKPRLKGDLWLCITVGADVVSNLTEQFQDTDDPQPPMDQLKLLLESCAK